MIALDAISAAYARLSDELTCAHADCDEEPTREHDGLPWCEEHAPESAEAGIW